MTLFGCSYPSVEKKSVYSSTPYQPTGQDLGMQKVSIKIAEWWSEEALHANELGHHQAFSNSTKLASESDY